MAWWTKVRGVIEKHGGTKPKLAAAIRLNFAVSMGGAQASDCALYKQDPAKHPDTPDLFPAELEKARKRTARSRP
jgi:hypothetical protein